MPKNRDDEPQLPAFLDGVISVFEGIGRPRVSFIWIEIGQDHPCKFCGVPTEMRLQGKRQSEVMVEVICGGCKDAIADAPTA